jgi:hypothetical protein
MLDNIINVDIIVPITPTNKQYPFLHKHFDRALDSVTPLKNAPSIKKINTKIPKLNAIQIAVSINGIKPDINSVPTITLNIILKMIPIQLQALKSHLSLLFIISFTSFIERGIAQYII